MTAVPDTLDQALDPSWLGSALSPHLAGSTITAVEVIDVVSRVSTNARVRIELDAPAAGFPASVCVKGYFTERGRVFRPAGVTEASFYRELAPSIPVRTLRCLYADVDLSTSGNVVITQDVVPEGAVFLDGLSPYTPDQVAQSLSQLAQLHASGWQHSGLGGLEWLTPRLDSYLEHRGVDDVRANFNGPIGAGVPRAVADAARLVDAYRSLSAEIHADTPWTVVHGDPHVGNLYLDAAQRPCLLDWQLAQRAPSYLDVGYHVASSLTVEDRRSSERDLFAHYGAELRRLGANPPAWAVSWDGYRRGILHGFFLWAITLEVDPAITSALLTRLGTAADDHDGLASVP